MVQSEAILIDDEADPMVQALGDGSARLALMSDDHPAGVPLGPGSDRLLQSLLRLMYIPQDHAAHLIGIAPPAVRKLVRRGVFATLDQDGQVYVSLLSVLNYRRQQETRRRQALTRMIRISEDGGLYDTELDVS